MGVFITFCRGRQNEKRPPQEQKKSPSNEEKVPHVEKKSSYGETSGKNAPIIAIFLWGGRGRGNGASAYSCLPLQASMITCNQAITQPVLASDNPIDT